MNDKEIPTPGKDFCDRVLRRNIAIGGNGNKVDDQDKLEMQGMILDELVAIRRLLER